MRSSNLAVLIALASVVGWGVAAAQVPSGSMSSFEGSDENMNPDISVDIDGFYHYDNSEEGLAVILSELEGFGEAHGHGDEDRQHDHGHAHGGAPAQGFNLRHLELVLSGRVDPAFKAHAIVAVDRGGAELEEAAINAPTLPWSFAFRFGKFFSDFGRLNPQHKHYWDFVSDPLVNLLLFGPHGVNDVGVQLSWLAPTSHYLLLGGEVFEGSNELLWPYLGEEPVEKLNRPRAAIGWVKYAPPLGDTHALQIGASYGTGRRQEAHDESGDGDADHWLDGDASFWGGDLVYKYDSEVSYGRGDVTVQAEYYLRTSGLTLVLHEHEPDLEGSGLRKEQDGYYVQAVYGFASRWRLGLRWEQAGLTNRTEYPDGDVDDPGASNRLTFMTDFTYTEYSRMRLEVSRGTYQTHEGEQDVWGVEVELQVSLGVHGAHRF